MSEIDPAIERVIGVVASDDEFEHVLVGLINLALHQRPLLERARDVCRARDTREARAAADTLERALAMRYIWDPPAC